MVHRGGPRGAAAGRPTNDRYDGLRIGGDPPLGLSESMRLGLLGPAHGDLNALARSAQVLLDDARADKVVYLAADDAMEQVVTAWARQIVGGDPDGGALFDRAAERCAKASAFEIEAFVAAERALLGLSAFVSLPPAPGRTIELVEGRVVLLVYDKAALDEEDIAGASVLVFGKAAAPLVKRVGTRVFIAPGPLGPTSGRAVLEDSGGAFRVLFLDEAGLVVGEEALSPPAGAGKMRVQGEPGRP